MNDLIAISVDQVVENLDEETRHKFDAIASHYYQELSQYDSGDLADD